MTIYMPPRLMCSANNGWCIGWDWRWHCFQPGQPLSITVFTQFPLFKIECLSWKWHACHECGPWKWDVRMPWICTQPFLHAMNAVHENDMYAMNAMNLHTTFCACHKCGPWKWHVCHECHESAHNLFSLIIFFHCYHPIISLHVPIHHATISPPETVLCHARIQLSTWQSPQS